MICSCLILISLLLSCAALPLGAQDVFLRPASEAFVDKETRLVFPAQLDTFAKVRVSRNLNPVFGTVIRYENEAGTCADIYLYALDTGAKPVSTDQFKAHCAETVSGILNLAKLGGKVASVERLSVRTQPTSVLPFSEAFFRIKTPSESMDSLLAMTLFQGRIVKVRVSCDSASPDELKSACAFSDRIRAMMVPAPVPAKTTTAAPQPQPKPAASGSR